MRKHTNTVDRLPPHSPEAEQGVLGCILLSPNECLDETMVRLGEQRVFYDLRHQTIYDALVDMRNNMEPIDLITVQGKLKDLKLLEQVGGITYLSQLIDSVPSAANLSYYLDIMCEKFLLRQAILHCTEFVGKVYDYDGECEELLTDLERDTLAIRGTFYRGRIGTDIQAVQRELIESYEAVMKGLKPAGIVTQFHDWNRKLGGMLGQEMIVIGGTPSSGKTTLAMNIGYNCAMSGIKVSLISMETSARKLVHRLHCMAANVDGGGFLRGGAGEREFQQMVVGVSAVGKVRQNLLIHDTTLTDGQLAAICRQDYQQGARLFVVDMLQNIQARGDKEFEMVTAASRCIKNIAKELDVPVIVTSALNRLDSDKTGKVRRPTMHDLRQSGQIESDADKIVLLHCPAEEREKDIRAVTADVAKNKDGPLGTIALTLFASQFRFESASVGEELEEGRNPHAD